MSIQTMKKLTSRTTLSALAIGAVIGLSAPAALAQGFGGHPTIEPGMNKAGSSSSAAKKGTKKKKSLGPQTIVVDQGGSSGYTSIQKAINDVRWGGIVLVMPGDYKENISLTKPVSLQGDRGPGMRVRILPQEANKPCLTYKPTNETYHALVSNITFDTRDMTVESEMLTADEVFDKTQNLAKTDRASSGVACVSVANGVFTMKDCTIDGNRTHTGPLVEIMGGSVTLQKNSITDGRGIGVLVSQKHSLWDRAYLVDNNITYNLDSGIELISDATMLATGNLVHHNMTGIKYDGQIFGRHPASLKSMISMLFQAI